MKYIWLVKFEHRNAEINNEYKYPREDNFYLAIKDCFLMSLKLKIFNNVNELNLLIILEVINCSLIESDF